VENLIVVLAMRLLMTKASDNRLIYLIAASCALFELMFHANIDIALYYAVNATISAAIAFISIKYIKTLSAKVFSVFMLMQGALCLALIPDWSYTVNELLQFNLTQYNDILILVLIALGVTSSAKFTNS